MSTQPQITPIDKEISISQNASFNCKISVDGIIEYANHQFCEVSGYEEFDLIGESMLLLRHPDMPMLFFNILMERLEKKEPMRIIAKFLAKDGRYFWLMVDFTTKTNEEGEIIAHYSNSKPAPLYAVHKINALHKILSKIEEKTGDIEASKRYIIGFLEERNMSYNQYIKELTTGHLEYEQTFKSNVYAQRNTNSDSPFDQNMNFEISTDSLKNQDDLNKTTAVKQSHKKKSLLKKVFGK